jgi:hypothetical protein
VRCEARGCRSSVSVVLRQASTITECVEVRTLPGLGDEASVGHCRGGGVIAPWDRRLAALRGCVEEGVVDGHGGEHASRPAPAAAAFAVSPHGAPDDDGDATVVRVGPAMQRAGRSFDDVDCSLRSADVHACIAGDLSPGIWCAPQNENSRETRPSPSTLPLSRTVPWQSTRSPCRGNAFIRSANPTWSDSWDGPAGRHGYRTRAGRARRRIAGPQLNRRR